jgi:HAE1 family hydrophobic/amphiphilic exporter-1
VQAPPGSSLAYTGNLADRADAILHTNPDIAGSFSITGFSMSGNASNAGMMFVSTKPADERRGKGHSAADIVADLSPKLQSLLFAPNGGLVMIVEPPAVSGVGSFGGFEFVLQDEGANTLSDLDRVAHQMVGTSRQGKEISNLYTSFSANRCWSPSTARRPRR